jgi:hypothetical protein
VVTSSDLHLESALGRAYPRSPNSFNSLEEHVGSLALMKVVFLAMPLATYCLTTYSPLLCVFNFRVHLSYHSLQTISILCLGSVLGLTGRALPSAVQAL